MESKRGSSDASREAVTVAGPSPGAASATCAGIGRYVVLEEIGRGGMGRVLRAYDPKLQREVALKEVHHQFLGPDGARRLVAEARAMAMLSHPNVVAVYDVEHGEVDQVVLVMEYVAGQTLRAWCREGPHPWQQIVRRFVDAGRGLAAAHAAGLLHRDFKPTNVLVGEHGVKVTDFGLAKLGGTDDGESLQGLPPQVGRRSGDSGGPSSSALGSEGLTEAGMVLGTPRYMPPEQHRGDALTEAADQYALCVALWEALCGKPPFTGARLEHAKIAGPPPWPGGAAPRPVVEALRRGLAADPAKRWPSTEALLDALRYDPTRRRKRWWQAGAAVGVLGLTGAGWQAWSAARAQRCTEADAVAHLQGSWDDEQRSRVRDAILGIGASYATDVWEATQQALDAYATDWAAMHTETCAATTVRGEQSTTVMNLRMACLHRAKLDLQAATAVLAEADAQTVQKAHELTGDLRPLSRCADIQALQAEVEPPLPEEADAVETLRQHLALATATMKAGHYDASLQNVDEAETVLRTLQYGPVQAEVSLARGDALQHLGRYPEAETALRQGLQQASRSRQWELLQSIATKLVFVVGYRQQRFNEGLQYADLARGLAAGDPTSEARVDSNLAVVRYSTQAYDEAAMLNERALAIWEKTLGREHLRVTATINNLAAVRLATGDYDEAAMLLERVLDIRERTLGHNHPHVATTLNNLAAARHATGHRGKAVTLYERALAISEEALGHDHPRVATSLNNLGNVRQSTGAYAEAATLYERALAIWEKALGPDHPEVANALNNLGNARHATGDYAEAATLHERALAIWEKALGPDHTEVATGLSNLANVHRSTGAYDEAAALYRRALGIRENALGPDHPDVAYPLVGLARVALGQRRPADAVPLAERGVQLWEAAGVGATDLADARFLLAQVLVAANESPVRAVDLATQARDAYRQAGAAGRETLDRIEAFLRERYHAGPARDSRH